MGGKYDPRIQGAVAAALERVKTRVKPKDFQIFDLLVLRQWPMAKVTAVLEVNRPRVYLAKHRLMVILKQEMKTLEVSWAHA